MGFWGLIVAVVVVAGCGGRASAPRAQRPEAPRANVKVGDCGDPGRNGVVSARPRMRHADRDLDGDGVVEAVVADRNLCGPDGNCQWNIFIKDRTTGCHRYAGTVAGRRLQYSSERGEHGFVDIRAWWDFGQGGRVLYQRYRYRRGAYHIVETLVCKRGDNMRVICGHGRKPAEP